MEIQKFPISALERLVKNSPDVKHVLDDAKRYHSTDTFTLETDVLITEDLWKLMGIVKADKYLFRRLELIKALRVTPTKVRLRNLPSLREALVEFIAPTPNHWLFYTRSDSGICACYVSDVTYTPPERRSGYTSPPYVTLSTEYMYLGEKKKKDYIFYVRDLGRTVEEVLNEAGLHLETKEAVVNFREQIDTYLEISVQTGKQFLARGKAIQLDEDDNWWRSTSDLVTMVRNGSRTKVVMDNIDEEGLSKRDSERDREQVVYANTFFWNRATRKQEFFKSKPEKGKKGKKAPEDDNEEEDLSAYEIGENEENPGKVLLPVHPYVKVFDLDKHQFVCIHVDNLKAYEYTKGLAEKLILPPEEKELLSILVWGSEESFEDIIKGKTGGVIVVTLGPAGTGKTLTAEVFSEDIERPLYVVQCSQLGIDPATLEQNLSAILRRAERWGAILFLDEADVYVRMRENDLTQNAVIGVFLRILEYYKGVMFMASNRDAEIDDAILSRATAIIRYKIPTVERLQAIWGVLSQQFKVELTKAQIKKVADALPNASGRNVKNLLKLAKLLARKKKQDVTPDLLISVAKFSDIQKV